MYFYVINGYIYLAHVGNDDNEYIIAVYRNALAQIYCLHFYFICNGI